VTTPWWIAFGLRVALMLCAVAALWYLPWLIRRFRASSANTRSALAPDRRRFAAEPTIPPGMLRRAEDDLVIIADDDAPEPKDRNHV
jgi:hypothetical protein